MLHPVFAQFWVATNVQRSTKIECNIGLMSSDLVSEMLETNVGPTLNSMIAEYWNSTL